ncbi:MAG TPA: SRPBCC family protein [bacterium]
MGLITGKIEVGVDPAKAFEIAQEVEKYPDYMPDVKSINVIERRDDGFARVAWVGHVSVASINKDVKWIEDEWWDKNALTCTYKLVEGDYKKYSGDWNFTGTDSGSEIVLNVDFDLGLPLVGPMINKLLDRIMQDNVNGMLKAIKDKAEEK